MLMFMQQKLFQLHTAMIEVLMRNKYDFVVHLVPIKIKQKNSNFLSQLIKFNVVTSCLMKLSESKQCNDWSVLHTSSKA